MEFVDRCLGRIKLPMLTSSMTDRSLSHGDRQDLFHGLIVKPSLFFFICAKHEPQEVVSCLVHLGIPAIRFDVLFDIIKLWQWVFFETPFEALQKIAIVNDARYDRLSRIRFVQLKHHPKRIFGIGVHHCTRQVRLEKLRYFVADRSEFWVIEERSALGLLGVNRMLDKLLALR